jgi:hypothetical protein
MGAHHSNQNNNFNSIFFREEELELIIKNFVAVTNLGHNYNEGRVWLETHNWNLQAALDAFFATSSSTTPSLLPSWSLEGINVSCYAVFWKLFFLEKVFTVDHMKA